MTRRLIRVFPRRTKATPADDEIVLPYKPRRHFVPFHQSIKRWKFAVCHRRAGKTVALANALIAACLDNPRTDPPPRYAYVGPSFDQAKDLVWNYLKHYTAPIPDIRALEGELTVIFPKGGTIRLYGGAMAYERMRGIYLDGAVLDEYPLLAPQAFTSVVRPALADYRGFAIVSGTSAGDDHFHKLKLRAEDDPDWDIFDIKITDTGEEALTHAEVEEMRKDMSPDEFAREMMNSFEAPVEGAYYAEALNSLQLQNRVCKVAPDLNASVITSWDLGIRHFASGVAVPAGRARDPLDRLHRGRRQKAVALHRPAHPEGQDQRLRISLPSVAARRRVARALDGLQLRRHELTGLLAEPVITVPNHNTEDGISVVRQVLGTSWFDETACRRGLARLRSYRRGKSGIAVPDEAEDAADAFRTGCVGLPMITSVHIGSKRLRRRIRGLV